MKPDLSVAVVGAGKWGQNLIKNFHELGVLAAIVESDEARGQALAKSYGVKYYRDLAEVLSTQVAAIAIATPVLSHYHIAKQALLAKKDVFVEKPITVNVVEAQELVKLAEENNSILMVGHLLLYQPAIQFIKEFLQSGKLGKIRSFHQTRRSLGTIRTQENVLYSLGVHDLAVLNYLAPEPIISVTAVAQEIISPTIADEMLIHLQFKTGVQAHVYLSWLWPTKERQLMVQGEKGALLFNEITQQVIHFKNYGNHDASITQEGQEVIFEDTTPPLKLELQHFLECIITRALPRSPGVQGMHVVELMASIMKASAHRKNSYADEVII